MPRLDPTTGLKVCTNCRGSKTADSFSTIRSRPDGLDIYCKECRSGLTLKHYHAHKEAVQVKARQYYQEHREERLEANRRWYDMAEKASIVRRLVRLVRRGRKAGALQDGSITTKALNVLLSSWTGCCPKCGREADPTVDHILALANGGSHIMSNLQLLCKSCNSSKGAR